MRKETTPPCQQVFSYIRFLTTESPDYLTFDLCEEGENKTAASLIFYRAVHTVSSIHPAFLSPPQPGDRCLYGSSSQAGCERAALVQVCWGREASLGLFTIYWESRSKNWSFLIYGVSLKVSLKVMQMVYKHWKHKVNIPAAWGSPFPSPVFIQASISSSVTLKCCTVCLYVSSPTNNNVDQKFCTVKANSSCLCFHSIILDLIFHEGLNFERV